MTPFSRHLRPTQSVAISYLTAVGVTALCTLVAIGAMPFSQRAPFLIFFPGILFVLWYSGLRAAVVSTVLAACAVDFFLMPPRFSFSASFHDFILLVAFVAVLVLSSWVIDRHRSRKEDYVRIHHRLLLLAAESNFITDAQHRIIHWQESAVRMYGWTEAEADGKSVDELLQTTYPESPGGLPEIDRQLQQTGRWQGRLIRCRKDGSSLILESSWAKDDKTRYTLQSDLDVTEKARAADELLHLNLVLKAINAIHLELGAPSTEDAIYQAVVKALVEEGKYDLVWIGSRADDLAHSVRVRASSGFASELLASTTLSWEHGPLGRGAAVKVLRGEGICIAGDLLKDPEFAPWRELTKKHGLRSVLSLPLVFQGSTQAALVLFSSHGNAFGEGELALLLKLAEAISHGVQFLVHRQEAEAERAQRESVEAQLLQSQKLESLGRLAGGIAHDFNNLLMVISAQTEMLTLQLEGQPLERAKQILRSTHRAAELTSQLLAYSRKQIHQPKLTTMDEILQGFSEIVARLVGEDVEVLISSAGEPWPIRVDKSQMEQIVMNLVVNARDAMPNGGRLKLECFNVSLSSEYSQTHPLVAPGPYVLLAVTDTGIGMDEATKALMFEPFFTTKAPGKGTGLGLAMVYGIVKQNGGFIWVYSEPGQGTCFKIYLPVAVLDMQPAAPVPAARQGDAAAHKYSVLVVEDEDQLREIVSEFLRIEGHQVTAVESRDHALKLARDLPGSFDLLLTDVVLKDGSGRDLAEAILSQGGRTKVIYMSGYTPNAIVHHGVLEEKTMFLQKPFTRRALIDKIHLCMAAAEKTA